MSRYIDENGDYNLKQGPAIEFDLMIKKPKPPQENAILYVCDGEACGKECPNEDCHHTSNIEHAANFEKVAGAYWEVIR